MEACEVSRWIALGVWSSAGGVVGSLSTPISSNAHFRCWSPFRFDIGCQSPDGRDVTLHSEFRTYNTPF